MLEMLLPLICGAAVGLSLGLTGGGGSLFALPLLVYVLNIPLQQAVPASLVIVGLTALIGAIDALRLKLVLIRPTLIFAASGMAMAPVGLLLGGLLAENARLGLFAILAFVIAVRMCWQSLHSDMHTVRARLKASSEASPVCHFAPDGALRFSLPCALMLLLGGCLTGVLSGLFGVGGGFIIVPVLMATIKLPITQAIGSSLLVITLVSASGAMSAASELAVQKSLMLPFVVGGLAGMIAGRTIASRITGKTLQNIFAAGLFIVASAIIMQLSKGG